jgi:ribonuclease HII
LNKADIYKYENELWQKNYNYIVGTDEAGRGPMAGPLVVAAVVLPKDVKITGINDSKKLTAKKRDILYEEIIKIAVSYKIKIFDSDEVDNLNVYQASKLGMIECIKKIDVPVDYILTDAIPLDIGIDCLSLIKGDSLSASIAAASILAKVTRDRYMIEVAQQYPDYGFEKHKGYVTKYHLKMLDKYGPCPIHRKSFEPVRRVMYKQINFDI